MSRHIQERVKIIATVGPACLKAGGLQNLTKDSVDATRITAIGFGESYPIASNDTVEGRQENRRVDLMLRAKAR